MKTKRENRQDESPVEVACVQCGYTEIIYVPAEDMPKCPDCKKRMVIKELLKEGKSY